jgi:hypothetical protein
VLWIRVRAAEIVSEDVRVCRVSGPMLRPEWAEYDDRDGRRTESIELRHGG